MDLNNVKIFDNRSEEEKKAEAELAFLMRLFGDLRDANTELEEMREVIEIYEDWILADD